MNLSSIQNSVYYVATYGWSSLPSCKTVISTLANTIFNKYAQVGALSGLTCAAAHQTYRNYDNYIAINTRCKKRKPLMVNNVRATAIVYEKDKSGNEVKKEVLAWEHPEVYYGNNKDLFKSIEKPLMLTIAFAVATFARIMFIFIGFCIKAISLLR